MNLEQALDELHRWEREAKRLEGQLRDANKLLFAAGAAHATYEKSINSLKKDVDYAIGLIDMCREHFENIEAMADQWSERQAKIARLALDALPPKR